jgi:hypothetical protein
MEFTLYSVEVDFEIFDLEDVVRGASARGECEGWTGRGNAFGNTSKIFYVF